MVLGGLIAILISIWVYRTAFEAKTGKVFFWVGGAFILFMSVQIMMIYLNIMIIETFDGDVSAEYDDVAGLNGRDKNDTAGLQEGPGGTFIGILFELLPFIVPFFAVAVARQMFMLKKAFNFMGLFDGIKEVFISIKNSFKTT